MSSPLFQGPASLRDPAERLAFWLTLVFALPAAGAIGFVLHESVGLSQVALFIVVAMVYVTLARGRLLGSSVMLHEAQMPRVFAIVKRACAALEIPMPYVFVREDYNVPAAALGFGEPYALVISSHWIEHFSDDELAFVIGRQLGHIAAGHTRYLSLLSINGNENPIVALIFGAWLRRCELTCDKIGLLVCGSLDAAVRAIAVCSFHHFGRNVDLGQFAEQAREISGDSVLRWGEWLGAEPYATKRIYWMRRFIASHQFQVTEEWFLREITAEPPALPAPGTTMVVKSDCAGWWRRLTAFAIDAVLVLAIIGALQGLEVFRQASNDEPSKPVVTTTPASTETVTIPKAGITVKVPAKEDERSDSDRSNVMQAIYAAMFPICVSIYLFVLVAVAGQSFGMMITGLRVVTLDYRRPGIFQSFARYATSFFLWPLILCLSPFSRHVMLHDLFSGTRMITAERIMARTLASPA